MANFLSFSWCFLCKFKVQILLLLHANDVLGIFMLKQA
ncbi:hypothetical protein QQP08_021469 [Theobroma cacao]|nr:hypothetical protein QQP08_021469 [Theobroma cacao]